MNKEMEQREKYLNEPKLNRLLLQISSLVLKSTQWYEKAYSN